MIFRIVCFRTIADRPYGYNPINDNLSPSPTVFISQHSNTKSHRKCGGFSYAYIKLFNNNEIFAVPVINVGADIEAEFAGLENSFQLFVNKLKTL